MPIHEPRSKSSLIEELKPGSNILLKSKLKSNRQRAVERTNSPNPEGEVEETLPLIKVGPNDSSFKYLYNDEKFGKKRSVLSYHKDGKPVENNRPPKFSRDEPGITLPDISARFTEYMLKLNEM